MFEVCEDALSVRSGRFLSTLFVWNSGDCQLQKSKKLKVKCLIGAHFDAEKHKRRRLQQDLRRKRSE